MSVWQDILSELRGAIATALPGVRAQDIACTDPPSPELGHVAVPCFALGKTFRKPPQEIASRIVEFLDPHPLIREARVAGPYVNLTLRADELARRVLAAVTKTGVRYGDAPATTRERIVLEFVSPNANKPLHLGHLRNSFLGEAIARLLEACGATVHRVCLVNDRGVHIMKSLVAYAKWGDHATPESAHVKGDHFVGNWYVRFEQENNRQRGALPPHAPPPEGKGGNEKAFLPLTPGGGARGGGEGGTSLEQEAAEWLRRWEAGDPEVRALWARMTDWVLAGFEETYQAIGIRFDRVYRESDIAEEGRRIVADALARGTFVKDAKGNTVAPLQQQFGIEDKVVERADGTTVYATQDLALSMQKERDFHPDSSIIVTGNEQDFYFRQLFKIFELLAEAKFPGFRSSSAASDDASGGKGSARPRARSEQASSVEGKSLRENREVFSHRSYGMVELPEGKMKSREGTVVDADDLLDELMRLAEEEIRSRADAVPGEPTAGTDEPPVVVSDAVLARAKDIALAAIRFYLLLVTPETTVTFDPKASLAFTGKTGPYLQYAHARMCSIQRKAEVSDVRCQMSGVDASMLKEASEVQLLLHIARFPDVVAASADALDPSTLTQYLYDLAKAFADFYRDVPVLQAPDAATRDARLALVDAVRTVLARGLTMLGIAPLEEM